MPGHGADQPSSAANERSHNAILRGEMAYKHISLSEGTQSGTEWNLYSFIALCSNASKVEFLKEGLCVRSPTENFEAKVLNFACLRDGHTHTRVCRGVASRTRG